MGFSVTTRSLSALTPVKFTYKFNKEEKLSRTLNSFNNGFEYYTHDAFQGFQDAALSKKNCLILTNSKPLKEVFDNDSRQIDVGTIAGCVFLKTASGENVTSLLKSLYIGGIGDPLLITIIPIANNIVELRTNNSEFIQVDSEYPYTASISNEILDETDLYLRQFEMDYKNGVACFKTKTKDGYRYLSYGVDRVIRAVGVMLNDVSINPYLFTINSVTDSSIQYDFEAKTSEVKYYNGLIDFADRSTINVKDQNIQDTNLLISCTTADIAESDEVVVNIALTKTNFSSSGSYSPKK